MIICFKNTSKHGPRVQAAVEEVYAKESIVVCHSLKDALLIPKRSAGLNDIFILLAEDQQELSTFSGYVSQLLEHNLILVLPDKGIDNLLAGCDYQPKYMADMNGDFKDIQEVIKKISSPLFSQSSTFSLNALLLWVAALSRIRTVFCLTFLKNHQLMQSLIQN